MMYAAHRTVQPLGQLVEAVGTGSLGRGASRLVCDGRVRPESHEQPSDTDGASCVQHRAGIRQVCTRADAEEPVEAVAVRLRHCRLGRCPVQRTEAGTSARSSV